MSSQDRSLLLLKEEKQRSLCIEKCIICQKEKRSEKTVSTENGRGKLKIALQTLQDDLLAGVSTEDEENIRYHLKECYKKYILRAERAKDAPKNDTQNVEVEVPKLCSPSRVKRRKTDEEKSIICDKQKYKNDKVLYRLCEPPRVQKFMDALKFKLDEVYTRCSIYQTVKDLFAADILSHKSCMNRYLIQYQRELTDALDEEEDGNQSDLKQAFETILEEINLEKNAYSLSECRDKLNEQLKDCQVSNRQLKKMHISEFGQDICFSYPRDKQKSQMFFSSNVSSKDLVETLHSTDVIKACADKLKKECEEFNFGLSDTYCDGSDIGLILKEYDENRPESWTLFFYALFSNRKRSKHIKRKCDNIFQIIFNMIHSGGKRTPMHVSSAQTVHDTC